LKMHHQRVIKGRYMTNSTFFHGLHKRVERTYEISNKTCSVIRVMVPYLVPVWVDEIGIELDVLALHDPSWASLESVHGAALRTLLQVVWS
jgi:hypothetical protein